MKKTIFVTLSLLVFNSFFLNAQTIESYTTSSLKLRAVKIELQENFYKKLVTHPRLKSENITNLRQFFFNNLKDYQKTLSSYISSKNTVSKSDVNKKIEVIINASVSSFNKDGYPIKSIKKKKQHHHKGAGDPCTNMGFENCDYTGWILRKGEVDANAYGFINDTLTTNWGNGSVVGYPSSTGGDQHFIVNGGLDPHAPIQMKSPNGGTCTALLGDGDNIGGKASRMSQTFLIDANNANFSYQYALVLQDPAAHTVAEAPYFQVQFFDSLNIPIACGANNITAQDSFINFIDTIPGLVYKDWATVAVNLSAYIGQNITVEFTTGDCSQTGHYGYAYIDASCEPLKITTSSNDTILCGDSITLFAPAGIDGSYLWSTGDTTMSITVDTAGNYSVDLINKNGCSTRITTNITSCICSVTANFSADMVCFGNTTTFNDLSLVNGGIISTWQWDFNNDGVFDSNIQNPVYSYLNSGIHNVTLIVTSDSGCIDTITLPVLVHQPIADFTFSQNGGIINFTDASIGNGITSWDWDFADGNTSTAQNPTNTYSTNGQYIVELIITDSNGCSSFKLDTIDIIVTGIAINENDNSLLIYPNPSNGVLNLTNNSNENITGITIINTFGKVVYHYKNENTSFEKLKIVLENVASGNYFVKVMYSNDELVTKKVLVE